MTLGAAFATGRNNFDLMRLGGATLVLVSHSWVLTGHAEDEPFARAMGRYTDGGGLAVAMFFVLSGFLIARSALVHRAGDYVRARALRIYPAFAVVVLMQVMLLGPLASSLPVGAYFSSPGTWAALATSLAFSPPLGLPGVFEPNPVPLVVNGSLWTLRIEVLCYAGLLGLALIGLLRKGWILVAVGAGFGLLAGTMAARAGLLPPVLGTLKIVSIVDCVLHFLMGSALFIYRDIIPRTTWLAAAGLAVLAAAAGRVIAPALFHLVLPYLVLWLGVTRPILPRLPDISYGTYLVAFPIQQSLVAWLGPTLGPGPLIALALPLSWALGLASWYLLEYPVLTLKRPSRSPASGRRQGPG